ncbi:hypothetical protein FB390_4896 [Nocardia bhagyanarayanae]|uniref:Uncharacterized protein n=1 Tax=Nocardia bhagyanarayanae TaxID=1215925 RepID=A0A543FH54_9NOCA|nr:hypothetical protein FB390_4896 [Nocardia bhagyanarayanae]
MVVRAIAGVVAALIVVLVLLVVSGYDLDAGQGGPGV